MSPLQSANVASSLSLKELAGRTIRIWAVFLALGAWTSFATDSAFYRISGPTNQTVLNLSIDGTLSWDGGAPGGFTVERSADLSQGTWAPWARGTSVTATA